jgi:hypothetical protein
LGSTGVLSIGAIVREKIWKYSIKKEKEKEKSQAS